MKRLCLFLSFFFLLTGAAQADVLVSLKRAAEVRGAAIRLSDVFEGIPEKMDKDLAVAPEPGKSVTYNVRVLAQLAKQYDLIWRPQSMTDAAVLTRAATVITPAMVREKIAAKLREIEKRAPEFIEVVFDNRTVGFSLPVTEKAMFDLNNFSYDPSSRRFQAELVAKTQGVPQHQTVMGHVILRREIPVLAARISGGTVLGARDLSWQTVEEDKLPRDALTDAAQIVGMELKMDRQEGDLLRDRDLIPPRLVTRGALVTLKVETPLMQVTVRGRALQDGAKGEVVRVTNTQSNRVIEGVVESSGVVRVQTAKQIASAN